MRVLLIVWLALAGLASKSMAFEMESRENSPEVLYVKDATEMLATHHYAEFENRIDPAQLPADRRKVLEQIANLIPLASPVSVKLVGWWYFTATNRPEFTDVSLQYAYPGNQYILVQSRVARTPSGLILQGYRLNRLPDSLENMNRFTLKGRPPKFYLVLVGGLASLITCLTAFVICVRTRPLKRKWLWLIACLIGVGTYSYSSGPLQPDTYAAGIGFRLLGFGCVRSSVYSPWVINVSLPLGAIAFLALRKRLMASATKAEAGPVETDGTPPAGL